MSPERPVFSPRRPTQVPSERRPQDLLRGPRPERGPSSPSLQLESQLALGWPQPFSADALGKLVVMRDVDPAVVAQFQRLAVTLHRAHSDRGLKTLLVTSAAEREGKTLTTVNLALTLSQSKGRVLLIDADLRAPSVHRIFQVSAGTGLAGCLRTAGPVTLPVVNVTSNLALLPAGASPVDPSVLGSAQMRRVLAEVSQRFDWVVIDSAPVATVSQTVDLAALVDGVILVVEAERTARAEVTQAVEAIGRDRIMGVVLNRAGAKAVAE